MEKSNITPMKTVGSLNYNLLIDTFSSKNDIGDFFRLINYTVSNGSLRVSG
jgi:hypothetical protein